MWSMGLVFLIIAAVLGKFEALTIISPVPDSYYVLIPPSLTTTIPIELNYDGDMFAEVCLTLSGQIHVENSCTDVESNAFDLSNLSAGMYELHVIARGVSIQQSAVVSFEIANIEESLPSIYTSLSPLFYIANDTTNAADVNIVLNAEEHPMRKELNICIKIIAADGPTDQAISPGICFPSDQNSVTLYNLPTGHYNVTSEFQLKHHPYISFLPKSEIVQIRVLLMEDVTPELELPLGGVEVGLSPSQEASEEIPLPVSIKLQESFPFADVLNHLDCCIQLSFESSQEGSEPVQHCVPASADQSLHFALFQIPPGVHNYRVLFRSIQHPLKEFSDTAVNGRVEVRKMEEFVPSYDWAPLRAWHTLPNGLQTRLPVGTLGGVKEARIPEPWRLQLGMPHPCKYFLRMDMWKSTSIADIKLAAASKCGAPPSCIEVLGNGKTLADEDTTLSAGLFAKVVLLDFTIGEDICDNFVAL